MTRLVAEELSALTDWLSLIDESAEIAGRAITVAIPFPIADRELDGLLRRPSIVSVVVDEPGRAPADPRIGYFDRARYTWKMPEKCAPVVVIVGDVALSGRMVLAAIMKRCLVIYRHTPLGWHRTLALPQLIKHAIRRRQWASRVSSEGTVLAMYVSGHRKSAIAATEGSGDRVVIFNNSLAWGGAERQIMQTMLGLKQRGVEVTLVCEDLDRTPDHSFFLAEFLRLGLTVRRLSDFTGPFVGDRKFSLKLRDLIEQPSAPRILQYLSVIRQLRPQVVHCWQDQTSVLGGVAGALAGVPKLVLSGRNLAPTRFAYHQAYMRAVYQALAGAPEVVLTNNSEAGAEDYRSWLGLAAGRIRVVRNGYETLTPAPVAEIESFRQRLGIPCGVPVVGSIFRFYPEKRPLLWVDAAARLARLRPDVHFLVAGTGPMKDETLERAERLGIADRLHLPGASKDIALCLGAMTVFLLTSELEGTPNVVIEAQSLGVPAVVTPAGGAAETIADGATGLVTPADPEIIAQRIDTILSRREWREQAAIAAPQFVARRFGLQRMVDETLACYGLGVRT